MAVEQEQEEQEDENKRIRPVKKVQEWIKKVSTYLNIPSGSATPAVSSSNSRRARARLAGLSQPGLENVSEYFCSRSISIYPAYRWTVLTRPPVLAYTT